VKLFYNLDPLTCSQEEWDEQMHKPGAAPYDTGLLYNPNLFMPESKARAIRLTLARRYDPETAERWMERFWLTAVSDEEFNQRTIQYDSHGGIIPIQVERKFHAKSRS